VPDGIGAINISTTVNFVASVQVYHEYNDTSQTSATFLWEPESSTFLCSYCGGSGCTHCSLTEQDGCFHIRDATSGVVVPAPGSYDSDAGTWASASWSVCRDPDMISLYYYCGDLGQRYLRGNSCEYLSNQWAQTIAYMATSRLERTFCACGNLTALATWLQTDLALTSGAGSHQLSFDILDNPFGTRRGEVIAWQRVSRLAPGRTAGVATI
jgi:hypothetical protein